MNYIREHVVDIVPHMSPRGVCERWLLMSDGTICRIQPLPCKGDVLSYIDTERCTFSDEPVTLSGQRKIVRMSQYDTDIWVWYETGEVYGIRYNPIFGCYEKLKVDLEEVAKSPVREGYGEKHNVMYRYTNNNKSRLTDVEPDTTESIILAR